MARNATGVLMFLVGLAAAVPAAGAGSAGATAGGAPRRDPAQLVLGIDAGGGPYFQANAAPKCLRSASVYQGGCWVTGGLAAFDFTQGGLHVAVGDVTGDGRPDVVTVPGNGGRAEVRAFDGAGNREQP